MAGALLRSGGGRRRRGRRGVLSEINVTPFVDVMLVLLIIFMITAPLLATGIDVRLPKTEAGQLKQQDRPLTITVQADGRIYLQETQVTFEDLQPGLEALRGEAKDAPIYLRADGKTAYEPIAAVMARVRQAGFTNLGLVTDPLGGDDPPKRSRK